ncbi:porin family protein [Flavobacterium sp. HSC-61S13]|uniref:porin family protein n=1 Tax=Flavobacterium sp. HSC-61S13 TaxID=2910963 RepID=UPI00209EE94E|nr:porin family protein [Flavobacterium sp. HSC-61S13]MCP1997229.1 hypothetical protein [Flavobacterium sp. HSC-61S13]
MNCFKSICSKQKTFSKLKLTFAALVFSFSITSQAQTFKEKRFVNDYKWKVSMQMNIMDFGFDKDDATNTENWNMLAFPSRVAIETNIVNHLSAELAVAMNKIEKGKAVTSAHDLFANDDLNVLAIDGTLKYSIGGLLNIPIVDPYIAVGAGFLQLDGTNNAMFNYGGGINFWFADIATLRDYRYMRDSRLSRFGINLEILGKKNLNDGPGSNMQAAAGVFYMF